MELRGRGRSGGRPSSSGSGGAYYTPCSLLYDGTVGISVGLRGFDSRGGYFYLRLGRRSCPYDRVASARTRILARSCSRLICPRSV